MRGITSPRNKSKKTKRLGRAVDLRPKTYEAFAQDSKLECIRALISFGLMYLHELLEEEVCTLAGARCDIPSSMA